MKKQSFIALCAGILLTTTVTSASFAAGQGRAGKGPSQRSTLVVTEQVGMHNISQSLTLIGKLEAEQAVVIAPEVSGKISAIGVKANQRVSQGQALVQLEDDKASAQLAEANAYLKDELRKLTEFQKLAKRGAITQTEIDAQRASVDIARARLGSAHSSLDDLTLRAPFDGTIGFIDFSKGKLLSAGEALLTLDNLAVMRLDLQVPERYLSMLSLGMRVDATSRAWGEETFSGRLVGIDSRINEETLNLRVRIHFDNAERKLKPGMLMSAHLALPAIQAPIIPVQALQYSGTRRYVYIVDESNTAKRTEVTLGARVDNQVVIEKGVAIGERIVVQGIVNLRDGSKVKEHGQAAADTKSGPKLSNKDKS